MSTRSGGEQRRAYLRTLVALARSDGEVAAAELQAIGAIGAELETKLSPLELGQELDLERLPARIVDHDLRARLAVDLGRLALADGHGAPLELALVRDVARRLDVDPPRLPGVDWSTLEVPGDLARRLRAQETGRADATRQFAEVFRGEAEGEDGAPAAPVGRERDADAGGDQVASARLALEVLRDHAHDAPPVEASELVIGARAAVEDGGLCALLGLTGPLLLFAAFGVISGLHRGQPGLVQAGAVAALLGVGVAALVLSAARARARALKAGTVLPALVFEVGMAGSFGRGASQVRVERALFICERRGVARRGERRVLRSASAPRWWRRGERMWVVVPEGGGEPVPIDALTHTLASDHAGAIEQRPGPWGPADEADRALAVEFERRHERARREAQGVVPPIRIASQRLAAGGGIVTFGRGDRADGAIDPAPDQRCPYCRDELGSDRERLQACAACAVVFHRACLHETGGCTTVGCRNRRDGRSRARVEG